MLTRRFILGGLIAAPAVIAADKLMPVRSIVERYGTVWGVGWDLEVVEHVLWTPGDAAVFADFDVGGIGKFREVTDIVYTKPHVPLEPYAQRSRESDHWWMREYQRAFMTRHDRPVDDSNGMTNVVGLGRLQEWNKVREQYKIQPVLVDRDWTEYALEGYRNV